MVIDQVKEIIQNSLTILNYPHIDFSLDKPKFLNQGDLSTNVAMMLKKIPLTTNKNPIEIANEIVDHLDKNLFSKIEIVKPGFINFFIAPQTINSLLHRIEQEKSDFPHFPKRDEIISVEWVSANPTGSLHIGHARNAALGEVVAKLYEKIGYTVIRDYVVNDAGNQMNLLASSVLIRYLQLFNKDVDLPQDSYHGEEIKAVATALRDKYGEQFINVTPNENFYISDDNVRQIIRGFARDFLLDQIKIDLSKLGVKLDCYYSEQSTHDANKFPEVLARLGDYVYKKDGATWLKTTAFGDDKDRVLIKSDGVVTYFFPDIYYHDWKLQRDKKISKLVHVWGSDHYSYLTRVRAALKCLGYDADNIFQVIFMQMVKLVKDGQEYKMSKRTGQSLTLVDLVDAIGKDAANWFLISASASSHLEIDIDIALKNDSNNPLYYVQYASARAHQLLSKGNYHFDPQVQYLDLNLDIEKELINQLLWYKQTILFAINNYEPQKLVNYIYNLAKIFHSYYEQVKIIDENNPNLTQQRLGLVDCFRIVLTNALYLINIAAKTEM